MKIIFIKPYRPALDWIYHTGDTAEVIETHIERNKVTYTLAYPYGHVVTNEYAIPYEEQKTMKLQIIKNIHGYIVGNIVTAYSFSLGGWAVQSLSGPRNTVIPLGYALPVERPELKPGMTIQTKEGSMGLVVHNNQILWLIGNSMSPLPIISTIHSGLMLRIEKIFQVPAGNHIRSTVYSPSEKYLIWKVVPKVTVTKSEIAEKFGTSVEQLVICH